MRRFKSGLLCCLGKQEEDYEVGDDRETKTKKEKQGSVLGSGNELMQYSEKISTFSIMCRNRDPDLNIQIKTQIAGINGLWDVLNEVFKTKIRWKVLDVFHIQLLTSSFLSILHHLNMGCNKLPDDLLEDCSLACVRADNCLSKLMYYTDRENFHYLVQSILRYLDKESLWTCSDFPVVMLDMALKFGPGDIVLSTMICHLYDQKDELLVVQIGMARVVDRLTLSYQWKELDGIGKEVVSCLMKLLGRASSMSPKEDYEIWKRHHTVFVEAVKVSIVNLTSNLPNKDMVHVFNEIASRALRVPAGEQRKLLDLLLTASTFHKTERLMDTFTSDLLKNLMNLVFNRDSEVRLQVHQIIHRLLDRTGNRSHLQTPRLNYDAELKIPRGNGIDDAFLEQFKHKLFFSLHRSFTEHSNTKSHVEACFCTVALVIVEIPGTTYLGGLWDFIIRLQESARCDSRLPIDNRCRLLISTLCLMSLTATVNRINFLQELVEKVSVARILRAPYILPPLRDKYDVEADFISNLPHGVYFNWKDLRETVQLEPIGNPDVAPGHPSPSAARVTRKAFRPESRKVIEKALLDDFIKRSSREATSCEDPRRSTEGCGEAPKDDGSKVKEEAQNTGSLKKAVSSKVHQCPGKHDLEKKTEDVYTISWPSMVRFGAFGNQARMESSSLFRGLPESDEDSVEEDLPASESKFELAHDVEDSEERSQRPSADGVSADSDVPGPSLLLSIERTDIRTKDAHVAGESGSKTEDIEVELSWHKIQWVDSPSSTSSMECLHDSSSDFGGVSGCSKPSRSKRQ